MKATGKIIAWVCIFSTFLMGCYSSALIDPSKDGKERIYSGTIKSVLTKDGTEYVFRTAPNIAGDIIVGVVEVGRNPDTLGQDVRQVRIPISDVARVSVSEIDTGRTVVGVLVGVGAIAMIYGVIETIERPRKGFFGGW